MHLIYALNLAQNYFYFSCNHLLPLLCLELLLLISEARPVAIYPDDNSNALDAISQAPSGDMTIFYRHQAGDIMKTQKNIYIF